MSEWRECESRHACDDVRDERDRLRAENGRLRTQNHLDGADKQIERLKAALRRIVAEADSDDGLTAWDGSDIARAALEEKQ